MWASMMLDYAAQERIFELEVSNKTLASPLFTNANINRKLSTETLLAIIDEMVSNATGKDTPSASASVSAPASANMKRCLLYWRKLGEWADLVYSHVAETGQTGSIVTVYELFHSDDTLPFYNLPEAFWRRVLRILDKSGKAKLFDSEEGANSMELGIKFF